MEITFINPVAKKYYSRFISGDTFNTLFLVSVEPEAPYKKIELYNSESGVKSSIYVDFLNANTPARACQFCSQYGALINPQNYFARSSNMFTTAYLKGLFLEAEGALVNKKTATQIQHDFVMYDHFEYFRSTLAHIASLHKNLQENTNTAAILCKILTECLLFLTSNYLSHMLFLEYNGDSEPYINFDIYQYMYELEIFYSQHSSSINSQTFSSDYIINNSLLFVIPDFSNTRNSNTSWKNFLVTCSQHCKKVPSFTSFTDNDTFSAYFLTHHKKDIIELATAIISDALSYHLQEVHPIMSSSTLTFHYPSLISAIFFYYSYDVNGSFLVKKCANEKCQKLFAYSTKQTSRLYCCQRCAHNVSNRKSQRKKRAQQKLIAQSTFKTSKS